MLTSALPPMDNDFCWETFLGEFSLAAESAGFRALELISLPAGPLMVWQRKGPGSRVYLSAGMHGDEPAGPIALLKMMQASYFSERIHWVICPALNPSGLASSRRENADGVDMNRDYWTLTTQEVAAHTDWLNSQPAPDLAVSLHEDWETSGFYFYEINLGEDDPERAADILADVRPWFPAEAESMIDGHECRELGWIFHAAEPDLHEGWPEAIYLAKMGCPLSLTFETPSQGKLADRVAAHCAAIRVACAQMLD